MSTIKDTGAALKWIIKLFNKHKISFQITGGFAARLYGANRPLADIDICIPDKSFDDLYIDVKKILYLVLHSIKIMNGI